ncbi:MAG TPA: SAM-dependent methyltransferase, partial [Cytophagaceae bacterium]
MDFFHSAQSYIKHFLKAGDEHSIHSPFVFSFYSNVIRPQKNYYCFDAIEHLRDRLCDNHTLINVTDLGARGGNNQH